MGAETPRRRRQSRPTARPGWGPVTAVVFRFAFAYWLLYSLPLILSFPNRLIALVTSLLPRWDDPTPWWLTETMTYLGNPSQLARRGHRLARAAGEPGPARRDRRTADRLRPGPATGCSTTAPRSPTWSSPSASPWSGPASLLWRRLRARGRPNYDRLHA